MTQSARLHGHYFFWRAVMLAACFSLTLAAGCWRKSKGPPGAAKLAEEKTDESTPNSGRDVFNRMIIAYRQASSYADAGVVHLVADAGGKKVLDNTWNYALTWDRPNKVRLQAYQAMLVCDGKKLYGALENQPGQVLERPAPRRITLNTLLADRVLAAGILQGAAGMMPQMLLLWADEPMKALLQDAIGDPVLAEPGQIDGRNCYRVQLKRSFGITTFWVDHENFLLRRVVLPTEEIRDRLGIDQPIDRVSLMAEFPGVQINGKIDPKAFQFEVPAGAQIVSFFIPPEIAYLQLLGKKVPDFTFYDLGGKPVTPESLAGKVGVLDFWATWCPPCRESLPNLEKVYQRYKDNPKTAFYAVSVDDPKEDKKTLVKTFDDLKTHVPILRDNDKTAAALRFTGIPTMFIIGPDGVVQDCKAGADEKLAEELPVKIDKLLAGENIYQKPMKEYEDQLKQYAKMLELPQESAPAGQPAVTELKLPEVKTAPQSKPATMKLVPLWKCTEVKAPGNILVFGGDKRPARLAVVEAWKSLAEVGLGGNLIARHKLDLADTEVIGSLRSAAGADGNRYLVAFMATQQRCHLLDENWKLVVNYPEEALKKPHSGIADVELGDLDGDGKLKMYVSYLGVVGVQAVTLDGKRLWANRSMSNVGGMAIGAPDAKGRRSLFCTNATGAIVVLDAEGQRQREIKLRDRLLHWIVAAPLRGDGQLAWCGMSAAKLGENLAVGFSLDGKEQWKYLLPAGVPPPMELIVPGKLTRTGPGQWILPGPDGSIHVLAADGKPVDKFNSGVTLQGLATAEIDGQPVLIISSAEGLEAWKVE